MGGHPTDPHTLVNRTMLRSLRPAINRQTWMLGTLTPAIMSMFIHQSK